MDDVCDDGNDCSVNLCINDGGTPACLAPVNAADGSECDDGDAGNGDDVCTDGLCSPVACPCDFSALN